MRAVRAGVSAVLPVALSGCVARPALEGPMPVRNQHPAQLTVLHLPPAAASSLPAGDLAGRLDTAYSDLWLSGSGQGNTWSMDGDYLRTAPSLRVGLGSGLEGGIELPFAYTSGGFLDDFLIAYHDFFGMPDQGRDHSPRDQFGVLATKAGDPAWAVDESHFELLDVPLSLAWQVADPRQGLGAAVRGGVELPTGDDARGYGNGEVDWSLGLLLEQRAFGIGLYGHLQHTFAGTPDQSRAVGLQFADVTSLGLAAELPLADGFAALVQVEYETSTLRNLELPATAREQLLLWIGGRLRLDDGLAMEVGFAEDLQGLVSPDFTAWLGFVVLPGRSAP